MLNDKEGAEQKKNGLLPPKIVESDIVSLGHGLCGSDGSIYNKDTRQNTLSACTNNDRSVKATNESETSIQDLFHNTRLARHPRPQSIVFDNGSMGEFKRELK
jgi:hypothetical protein